MRESLRGALLSVLFFALLIGGSPSISVAAQPQSVSSAHVSPGTCADHGGTWVIPGDASPTNYPQGYCSYEDHRVDLSGLGCSIVDGMADWATGWGGAAAGGFISGNAPAGIILGVGAGLLGFGSWLLGSGCD